MLWTARVGARTAGVEDCKEEIISYLPLSHVAAQILDIYMPILFAATVYFAQPDALRVCSV
jgi:long-chain-fatty-acid--CoA ligase ACSBG